MITKLLMAAVLLVSTAATTTNSSTSESVTGQGWAVATINNETDYILNYAVKWGNDHWQSCTLYPGNFMYHYYETSYNQTTPILQVEFDADLTDWTFTKGYTLMKSFSYYTDCPSGKQYCFQKSGEYVDLYNH